MVSGKIYRFPDNARRLSTLALNLDGPNPSYAYELTTPGGPMRRSSASKVLSVSTGSDRARAPTNHGTTVAKGAWELR